jgi:tetratricopeptide (TPR) repeat protein
MKNNIARFWALVALVPLLIPGVSVSGQSLYSSSPTDKLSRWQAGRAVFNASKYLLVWSKKHSQLCSVNPGSIKVTAASLEFDVVNQKGGTKHLQINVKDMEKISARCGPFLCFVDPEPPVTAQDMEAVPYQFWFGRDPSFEVGVCQRAENKPECMHAADWFAAALNDLHATAIAHPAGLGDFHAQATAWRALATKPALVEGARILRLAAEDAIKRQKPDEALNDYELGVEADPTWAQGWFNAALLAGELGFYNDAVEHMQNYLELLPDAADAQSARDQIDLWKYKAGQSPAGTK